MCPTANTTGSDGGVAPDAVGSARIRTEVLDPRPAENYRNTFASSFPCPTVGDVLPPGWEGLYFPFASSFHGLRPDGTPFDDVVPDFGLPRRMYAGEDTIFHRPLRLGDTVKQIESLGAVEEKTGNRGRLVFADIERTYSVDGDPAIETVWHDVFLEDPPDRGERTTETANPFDLDQSWHRSIVVPDSRHLFRYSAITFNTHRVHYDRSWAKEKERLPDLLVHGPLTRNLLLDAVTCKHSTRCLEAFNFTVLAPLFVDTTITIAFREQDNASTEAIALDHSGVLAARGLVKWSNSTGR